MDEDTQEYPLDKLKGKDVVRVASYCRWDFDITVIEINPRDHDDIRHSISQPFDCTPAVTFGRLERLPLEVLHEICSLLDIRSLFRLRQLNRLAREVVSTVQGYRLITRHVLEALCIILRTNMASWFTLPDLLNVLQARDCPACGFFGGFIYLPSFTRCCLPCLQTSVLFRLIQPEKARKKFNVSLGLLRKSIPILKTVPGSYSMEDIPRKRRVYLLSEEKITSVLDKPGTTEADELPVLRYMAAASFPYLERSNGDVKYGISCAGCQIALEKTLYGSPAADSALELRDRAHSHEGFLEHFQSCAEAQTLWILSEEGTMPVELPPTVRLARRYDRDPVMTFEKPL